MKKITVSEIVKAVDGALITGSRETEVCGVTMDSRKAAPGMLFVAIPGERVDGHDFIEEAMDRGARAVLISARRDKAAEKALEKGVAIIRTRDTVRGLQDFAAYYLSLFPVKKLAVTGSSGKTTTKEMLYLMCSEKYRTIRSLANHNNDIGMPLSAFSVEEDTEAAIFEMGMDQLGEIHRLVELVRPDVGIITNVGIAHVERLGSRDNILKAKMEITDFFGKDNVLVVNRDSDLLAGATYPGSYRLVTAGTGLSGAGREGALLPGDVLISHVEDLGEKGIYFDLACDGEKERFYLPVAGIHNVSNAACAAAGALTMGVSLSQAKAGLSKFAPTDMRGHLKQAGDIKIIDDTYNANPESMRAALDLLSSVSGKRKVAILGDMFELGEEAEEYHLQLGKYASQLGTRVVLSVGKNARFLSEGAKVENAKVTAKHYTDRQELREDLKELIKPGDVILVKGSRAMEMDEVVAMLQEEFEHKG